MVVLYTPFCLHGPDNILIYFCTPSLFLFQDNAAPSSSSASSPSARGYQKKKIAPRIGAMYGAMNPLFIEDCVVQPSRLGKSGDFLDIGSGIGQVVVQVAATVGCKAIG